MGVSSTFVIHIALRDDRNPVQSEIGCFDEGGHISQGLSKIATEMFRESSDNGIWIISDILYSSSPKIQLFVELVIFIKFYCLLKPK